MTGGARRYSLSLNVDGYIKNTPFPAGYEGLFTSDGEPMDPAAALSFLVMEKAKGRKVIPMSADCGNPCEHAAQDCKGFDYSGGGCPGRLVGPGE